ncbi:MAG: efflux RND transporter periplasmic adaptor subunit [Alphaproteobacteria bacterium]|nr:efflux RND transporter periplasmic adaptor subunit [Alphaproteobacteria bacterium]MBL7100242.1 efflux RND transporter periplasmic adaptor subunit [Alphaproteobacteria bacterium]
MNIRYPSNLETVPSGNLAAARERTRGLSIWTWLILGVVAAVVLAFVAYSIFGGSRPKTPPPPPVIVQKVAMQDLTVSEHTIGTVVSNATVQVTARVQGQILNAFFTEGQMVKKGDLLFQIDPRPYKAAYDSATATLASTKAKAERYARLLALNAVAPQDADDARAAYRQAIANADAARLNLEYTQIRSPIDGKTGPILIQPGNQITANGSSSMGVSTTVTGNSALVVLTQLTPIKISFALPQADLPRIQKRFAGGGMTVALMQQNAPDVPPLSAKVDFVGNQVNDQTGTIELRATFGNENYTLVPGQVVDVGVVLDTLKHVTVVPHDAINQGPEKNFVYVVRDGKAVMVPVKVLHDDGTTAAIDGNVKVGDSVITDGQLRVVPGKPVTISKPQKA